MSHGQIVTRTESWLTMAHRAEGIWNSGVVTDGLGPGAGVGLGIESIVLIMRKSGVKHHHRACGYSEIVPKQKAGQGGHYIGPFEGSDDLKVRNCRFHQIHQNGYGYSIQWRHAKSWSHLGSGGYVQWCCNWVSY